MDKVGIVLSGGFAKGAYEIGVLKAIMEMVNHESIVALSASSIGVWNMFAFANGQLETAEKIWRQINFTGVRQFVRCVLQGESLNQYIDLLDFEKQSYSVQQFATLFNVTNRCVDYVDLCRQPAVSRRKILEACIALPPFKKPVAVSGSTYLDGAMVDNIPIAPLISKKLDCIICIYFDGCNFKFESNDTDSRIIKINYKNDNLIANSFSFSHIKLMQMIADGYHYAREVLACFFHNGRLKPSYLQRIAEFNQRGGEMQWRISCDVAMRAVNHAMSRYCKRGDNTEKEINLTII